MGDRYLGSILLQETSLRPEQLDEALTQQRADGGRLGEILVKMRAITEDDLLRALGTQLDIPVPQELKPDDVDLELCKRVPINFVKQHQVLPLKLDEEQRIVQAALADPLEICALDDLRTLLGFEVSPVLVGGARLLELTNLVYSKLTTDTDLAKKEGADEEGEGEEWVDLIDATDEAPIIRWINALLFNAVKERASDIHIEPGEKDVAVRYRIDGVLYETRRAERNYIAPIIARVKVMAGLNIAEKRLPQDGRIRRKIAGKDIDMRVATAPTTNGERVTIRLLDRSSVLLGLADIGFGEKHLVLMDDIIHRPHGILLVTGPTGSGKTTTLYASIAAINSPELNILTIEDPVEYQLEGISQVQVNSKIDLTFASGLRSFLRHDPDVIMVGEIRDRETAEIAIHASLTGHLVFSTIHTNDAAGGITRLVEMEVEPFLVASSVIGLLAQRLVRRVCKECRETVKPSDETLVSLGLEPAAFYRGEFQGVEKEFKGSHVPPPIGHVYRARERGCRLCNETGYTGRTGIYELLMVDDDVRAAALKNTDSTALKRIGMQKGMRTLRQDGALKVLSGITSCEEVMSVTQEDVE
ncbi:MAG TPA: type II secretion system ATPase GspE [Polyangia bacterium]|jgi:general secretion pathway protein E